MGGETGDGGSGASVMKDREGEGERVRERQRGTNGKIEGWRMKRSAVVSRIRWRSGRRV